jgi:hypothetical protein
MTESRMPFPIDLEELDRDFGFEPDRVAREVRGRR